MHLHPPGQFQLYLVQSILGSGTYILSYTMLVYRSLLGCKRFNFVQVKGWGIRPFSTRRWSSGIAKIHRVDDPFLQCDWTIWTWHSSRIHLWLGFMQFVQIKSYALFSMGRFNSKIGDKLSAIVLYIKPFLKNSGFNFFISIRVIFIYRKKSYIS